MISEKVRQLARKTEARLARRFAEIDEVACINTEKVMNAFKQHRVSDTFFAGTTGYGYDDAGRDALDKIYATVFGAESALVRIGFVNGTHAIAAALFAAVSPGRRLVSLTGTPYDTLRATIGAQDKDYGSLSYYGVEYGQIELMPDGGADLEAIRKACSDSSVEAVLIQRSRGYSTRRSLTVEAIAGIISVVRSVRQSINIVVDNCYGEFTEPTEPTDCGADIIAGSLIKNPGGGLAPAGGYVAGRANLIEKAAYRLTTPGIGGECGATLGTNRMLFQGFFTAPHTVAQALKTAALCAGMLEELGYGTSPSSLDRRSDIIQMVELGSPENLRRFCRGIQMGAPVDSFVTPEPWQMPGYDCEVIMAAGAFIQGSSIELSADGPLREPYAAYLQGGLTYESGRLGIMTAISEMLS